MGEQKPNEELTFADAMDYLEAAVEVGGPALRDLAEMDLSEEQHSEVAELVLQMRAVLAPLRRRPGGES